MMLPPRNVSNLVVTFILSLTLGFFTTNLLQTTSVEAQAVDPNLVQLHNLLLKKDGLSADDLTFQEFQLSTTKPSHFYLTMHNEFSLLSYKDALEITALLEGLNPTEVANIIHYSQIPTRYGTVDTDFINNKISSVNQTFNSEKQLFQDLTFKKLETIAYEIFANGSTSDTPFDLLVDFDQIEKLLFLDRSPSQFGDLFSLPQSSTKSMALAPRAAALRAAASSPQPRSSEDPANPSNDNDQNNANAQSQDDEPPILHCPTNQNLLAEIQNYNQTQEQSPAGQLNDNPNQNQNLFLNQVHNPLSLKPDLGKFNPFPPLCDLATFQTNNLTVCVRTEVIRKKARSFFPDRANCIGCEMQKIAKISEKLMSRSLTPKKLTGKYAQPAFCTNNIFDTLSVRLNIEFKPARADLDASKFEPLPPIVDDESLDISYQALQDELYQQAALGSSHGLINLYSQDTDIKAKQVALDEAVRKLATEKTFITQQHNYINMLKQRLTILNQNFETLNSQLQTLASTMAITNQKPECKL